MGFDGLWGMDAPAALACERCDKPTSKPIIIIFA